VVYTSTFGGIARRRKEQKETKERRWKYTTDRNFQRRKRDWSLSDTRNWEEKREMLDKKGREYLFQGDRNKRREKDSFGKINLNRCNTHALLTVCQPNRDVARVK